MKMIIVKKSVDQYTAKKYCHSLCLELATVDRPDLLRLSDYFSLHTSYQNHSFHTSLQFEDRKYLSITNMPTIKPSGEKVALLYHPLGSNDYELRQDSPLKPHWFICTQSDDDELYEGPEVQSFTRKGFHTTSDEFKPTSVTLLQDMLLPYFGLSVETNDIPDMDLVIVPEYMTIQRAQNYCQSYHHGTIFEPKSIEDVNILHRISTKYDFKDVWIGIQGVGQDFPRDIHHWKYMSSPSHGINAQVFEKIEQDNGENFVGDEFCTKIRGEVYLVYNQMSQRLMDSRPERLLVCVCAVPRAPMETLALSSAESMEDVPCDVCTNLIGSIMNLASSDDIFGWIEQECRTAIKSVFIDIDGDVCYTILQYLDNIVEFSVKYLPWLLCNHWNSCSYEEANLFTSGDFVNQTLPCETCRNKVNIVRGTIAMFIQDKEDQICFIFEKVLDFSLGCRMLQSNQEYAHQIVANILKEIDIEQVCSECTSSPVTEPTTVSDEQICSECPPAPICEPTTVSAEAVANVLKEMDIEQVCSELLPPPVSEPTAVSHEAEPNIMSVPRNNLLLHIKNRDSGKCLKYHREKIVVADCSCRRCPEGNRDFTTLKWWISGSRIVSHGGKVLTVSEGQRSVLTLSTYDESNKRQEWTITPLEDEEYFGIVSDYNHFNLAHLERWHGKSFVDVGVLLPDLEDDNQNWYFTVVDA